MKIKVDHDRCIASGSCVIVAPELFEQDEDGIVVVRREPEGVAQEAAARDAMHACPAVVIDIV